jgi:hypothetical protein
MHLYSPAEIIERRIECLMALGFERDEAERIALETYRPPGA